MEATRRSSTQFWPATYAERGAAVPFTTPAAAYSRVRKNGRDGLEVLVPGLSGGRGVYVIPWAGLKSMFKLTVHDRALHEEIEATKAATPPEVREAALRIAETGLAGVEVADAARRSGEIEANDRLLSNFHLIAHVVKTVSGEALEVTLDQASTTNGQRQIRAQLAGAADSIGITTYDMNVGIEYWADVISPLGAPGAREGGRCRRTIRAVNEFSMNLGAWARATPTDVSAMADVICVIATDTMKLARNYAATVDRYAEQPGETLKNWERAQRGIQGLLGKLVWLLDGWDNIVAIWEEAVAGTTENKIIATEQIFTHLPLVPRDELDKAGLARWGGHGEALGKLARPPREGGQGDINLDQMLRLEQTKARTL